MNDHLIKIMILKKNIPTHSTYSVNTSY